MSRTLIKRLRWSFFYGAMKLIAMSGIVVSLVLIGIALYGLISSAQEYLKIGVFLLMPSVALLAYGIKLLRLSKVSPSEIDKWFLGARQK